MLKKERRKKDDDDDEIMFLVCYCVLKKEFCSCGCWIFLFLKFITMMSFFFDRKL